MRRGAKPEKSKVEAKPSVARKSPKDDGARVRDLEKRLAEAQGQLHTRDRELTEALEQQRASGEILRVISSSPTDVQLVLDTIAVTAAHLCEAFDAVIRLRGGDELRLAAHHGPIPVVDTISGVRALIAGRAVLERRTVHIPDVWAEAEQYPESLELARRIGWRTQLSVPLLREGAAIGVIAMRRLEVRPFTDEQIALVETFADQAVIAIENVRLFNETKEALDRQTATSEILRVIANSPTDVQPTFEAVAENASRLCGAGNVSLYRIEGSLMRKMAEHGPPITSLRVGETRPITRASVPGRAIIDRATIHLPDHQAAEAVRDFPDARRDTGIRTTIGIPLLREGIAIGAFTAYRTESRPFTDAQVALLQTFADQAVIAIENVRLFNETKEALERQTATAEILRVISESPTNVQPVFDMIAVRATTLCDAELCIVQRVDGEQLHLAAISGADPASVEVARTSFPMAVSTESGAGRAVRTRGVVHLADVLEDPTYALKEQARAMGFRSGLAVPMVREGHVIGVIVVMRTRPGYFAVTQIELLKAFADQAVIAIENVRLFNETKEALDRQTATAEILRVISSSPTDVQPVFDVIIRNAVQLCDGLFGCLFRFDGERLHLVAHHNFTPEAQSLYERTYPVQAAKDQLLGPIVLEQRVMNIADVLQVVRNPLGQRLFGFRSGVGVPMVRDGTVIGAIAVSRKTVGLFPDPQVELLQSFADQAVIAIENVRLFTELKIRNGELTETLARQTATGEVLRAISGAQTDAQPVFDIIAASAFRLCSAGHSQVQLYREGLIHLAALKNIDPEGADAIRRVYPMRAGAGSSGGRAILTRAVAQIPDVLEDRAYEYQSASKTIRVRSYLAVPMLRDGEPIGAIVVGRSETGPFPDEQVKLLQTFADQAVIAIENVRLFTELQQKNEALTQAHAQVSEALDQQTATSEILRVISQSPTDVQPVFETIVRNATKLCEGTFSAVFRWDGALLDFAAAHNWTTQAVEAMRADYPIPATRATGSGRAILDCAVVQIADIEQDPEYRGTVALAVGFRSGLFVPMLREGTPVGAISVGRATTGPFSNSHVELLKTFADQAVIAIENVRLFSELQTSNRDLTTALDKQTATSDILRVISQSQTDIQPVFDAIVQSAVRLLRGNLSTLTRLVGNQIELAAFTSSSDVGNAAHRARFPMPLYSEEDHGQVMRNRAPLNSADARSDPRLPETQHESARLRDYRSCVVVPLLRHDEAIGTLGVARREPGGFAEAEITLLQTFADQAVIAIENVRLFNETREALDQQTATAEILRVISSSPTDLQPVFAAVLDHALTLCEASNGSIYQFEDGALRHVGLRGPHLGIEVGGVFPLESSPGRAIREKRTIHLEDILQELDWHAPEVQAGVQRAGLRTIVAVPLLREETAIGAIVIRRLEVRPFSEKQIRLLKTFADQAVIAIENVRLFTELQARTQELTRSVGQLTALGEVARAVSSTLELQTVLSTIVSRAIQLSGTDGGSVYEYDEVTEEFSLRASRDLPEAYVEQVRDTRPRRGEGAVGRVALTREPVQIADISDPTAYESRVRNTLLQIGLRALLAVPLIAEDQLVGALIVMRKRIGTFAAEEVALLQTFATQSALAIQNARLFREIEEKSRQLEVASQHKSEFLANMSHELRTPLNAIIGFSEVLSERMFGELNEKQEEYLKDIYASGTHLLSLINDILDLSKIEAGRMELELTDFHLPTALDSALTLVRERAGRRGISLQMKVDSRLGQIQADERKVRQVVLNLLSNAIKFTPEGGRIEVGAVPKDGLVEVSVSDTGVGIAPEDQEAVFEEFRQVGTADKKVEGTGLGLTLCRKFVELHGGRIWVKSELAVGSTFTFTLPVRRGE